jgi:GTP cyclohydrolase IA
MDLPLIRDGVTRILKGVGCDLRDANFRDTPNRVALAYSEIFAGLDVDVDARIREMLDHTFPCEHQQMIVARNVEVFSMCPHHLLPVHYNITVGYLPGASGTARVVGLSKLVRLVKLLAARPVLQEQMVNDISTALMAIPGCAGSGCIASGEHYCILMRGVKQSGATVVTNSLQGEFLTDELVRSEFMALSR